MGKITRCLRSLLAVRAMPNPCSSVLCRALSVLTLLSSCAVAHEDGVDDRLAQVVEAESGLSVPHALDASIGASVDGGAESPHDAGHGHHTPADEDNCPPEFPPFRPNMSVQSAGLMATLVAIDPVPPRQLVDNDWTIQVVDMATRAPVAGARMTSATATMPVHRHGGRWAPEVEDRGDGRFLLRGIDFKMRGAWLVHFSVSTPDASRPVDFSFRICVE